MKAALMRTGTSIRRRTRPRTRTRSGAASARASKGGSYTSGPDGKWIRTDLESDREQGRNEDDIEEEEEDDDDDDNGDGDDDGWLRDLVEDVNASLFVGHNHKQYDHLVVQSREESEGAADDEIGPIADNKEHVSDSGSPNDIVGISECGKILATPFGRKDLLVRCFLPRGDVVSVVEEFAAGVRYTYGARDFHRSISRPRLILRGEDRLSGNPIRRESGRDDLSSGKATRTGTLPFMAISALNSDIGPNKYYHDLESLFYLFVWVCIAGGEFNSRPGINSQHQDQHLQPNSNQAKKPSPSPPLLATWSGRTLRLDRPTPHSVTALKLKDISREKREVLTDSQEFESRVIGCIPECFEPVHEMMREIRSLLFQPMLEEEEEEGQRGRGRREGGRTLQYGMPVELRRGAGAGDVFWSFADILVRGVERLQRLEEVEEVVTIGAGAHPPDESSLMPRQAEANGNAIPGSANEDVTANVLPILLEIQ